MSGTFAQVVELVKQLSLDEKRELQQLLRKYLIDKRLECVLSENICGLLRNRRRGGGLADPKAHVARDVSNR